MDLKRLLDNADPNDFDSLKILAIELFRRGYVRDVSRSSEKDLLASELGLEYIDIFRDNAHKHSHRRKGWTTSVLLDALIELRRGYRVMLVSGNPKMADHMRIDLIHFAEKLKIDWKKKISISSYGRVGRDTIGKTGVVCIFDPLVTDM